MRCVVLGMAELSRYEFKEFEKLESKRSQKLKEKRDKKDKDKQNVTFTAAESDNESLLESGSDDESEA